METKAGEQNEHKHVCRAGPQHKQQCLWPQSPGGSWHMICDNILFYGAAVASKSLCTTKSDEQR